MNLMPTSFVHARHSLDAIARKNLVAISHVELICASILLTLFRAQCDAWNGACCKLTLRLKLCHPPNGSCPQSNGRRQPLLGILSHVVIDTVQDKCLLVPNSDATVSSEQMKCSVTQITAHDARRCLNHTRVMMSECSILRHAGHFDGFPCGSR